MFNDHNCCHKESETERVIVLITYYLVSKWRWINCKLAIKILTALLNVITNMCFIRTHTRNEQIPEGVIGISFQILPLYGPASSDMYSVLYLYVIQWTILIYTRPPTVLINMSSWKCDIRIHQYLHIVRSYSIQYNICML